jgi:hypothetical protein
MLALSLGAAHDAASQLVGTARQTFQLPVLKPNDPPSLTSVEALLHGK